MSIRVFFFFLSVLLCFEDTAIGLLAGLVKVVIFAIDALAS